MAYHFNTQTGYYNGGLRTIFPPNNVSLGTDGFLHLKVAEQDNCRDGTGSIVWCRAEAVVMFFDDANGKQANLGYGDYLVEAKLVSPPLATWADYDPNVAFGVFTYERPMSGTDNNPNREIDLAEVSRWGWDHSGPVTKCPYYGKYDGKFNLQELCNGNAQFALQDYRLKAGMVKRYVVGPTKEITLIMRWRAGKVTFEEYNVGGLTLKGSLPNPDYIWETPNDSREPTKDLSAFVPTDTRPGGELSCQRFHINVWLGNFPQSKNGLNPQGRSVLWSLIGGRGFPPAKMSEFIGDDPNWRLSHAGIAAGGFAHHPRPSSRRRQAVRSGHGVAVRHSQHGRWCQLLPANA